MSQIPYLWDNDDDLQPRIKSKQRIDRHWYYHNDYNDIHYNPLLDRLTSYHNTDKQTIEKTLEEMFTFTWDKTSVLTWSYHTLTC